MKLEEYLNRLKNCPDNQIEKEFGINDNWPIFLNGDFESVVEHFKESNLYNYQGQDENEMGGTGINHLFKNKRKTVGLQIFDWIAPYCTGDEEEQQRQKIDYNMTIMFHPSHKVIDYARDSAYFFIRRLTKGNIPEEGALERASRLRKFAEEEGHNEDIHWARAIAIEADNICQFLIKEKIPACIPLVKGYVGPEDYENIVYHRP